MSDRDHEDDRAGQAPLAVRTLSPAAPAVIWGAVMVAALAGAGLTVWRSPAGSGEKLVQAGGEMALRRDMAKLGAERDALAGRLALLERDVAATKTARRAVVDPETTGSIAPPPQPPAAPVGLSLGREVSLDAAKRRWTALAARFPQQLASLQPKVQRAGGATAAFDLIAGPFATRPEANRACAALAEQGLACDTTAYAGDFLGRP